MIDHDNNEISVTYYPPGYFYTYEEYYESVQHWLMFEYDIDIREYHPDNLNFSIISAIKAHVEPISMAYAIAFTPEAFPKRSNH